MILQIKRYLFWLFIEKSHQDWYDYWSNKNLDEYLQFRKFAKQHEFYDDNEQFVEQDKVSMYSILSDFLTHEVDNNFDTKFHIWLRN